MESETISMKIQGQREAVELAILQLRELYKMIIVGPIKQNDADTGVHVFLTINPHITTGQ